MPSVSRLILSRLLPLALLSLVVVGLVAARLERSAREVRDAEDLRGLAVFLARLAVDRTAHGCLSSALPALLAARPELAYAGAEAADGSGLGSAGDPKAAARWLDRTYNLRGVPVRVRLGYRDRTDLLGLVFRVAATVLLWACLALVLLGALVVLLRRHVRRPLEGLERWARGAGPLPKVHTEEVERLADYLASQRRLS